MARARAHVIETESRRIVPSLLPAAEWVERNQGERDYGVDLVVEHFENGEPTGQHLLLQLKGTDAEPPTQGDAIPFDFDVTRLARVERFATPLLLIYCPVTAEPKRFWFLWLQEYIGVVLDHETPDWRSQTTIRIQIPAENCVPSADALRRLRFISRHPVRVAAFGQLARLAHEARWAVDEPAKLAEVFERALGLDAIFGDPDWGWGTFQRLSVERGLRACQILLEGRELTDADVAFVGQQLTDEGRRLADHDLREFIVRGAAQHSAQLLSTAVAIYFDARLRHAGWLSAGDHDF